MDVQGTRLELHIEVDASPAGNGAGPLPVRGSVRSPDGDEAAFTGWVGLLALLQEVATDAAR
jgi:hypothetical protein